MLTYDFSVIIPTHNRSEYLQEAIRSIFAQQARVEIIVVDDASTDSTPEIMVELAKKHSNIVSVRNESSLFAHRSRQRGFSVARGNYIVFMDDDDYYIDDSFFAVAKSVMEEHAEVNSVLGSTVSLCDGQYGSAIDLHGSGIISNRAYLNHFGVTYPKPDSSLTAVFRKTALDAAGLSESKMVNDTCIYLCGILDGDVYLHNQPVATYRLHASNISNHALPIDFVLGTLNEKIRIYKLAKKAHKLERKRAWLYHNLRVSVFYFVRTNKRDFKCLLILFFWVLLHGHGTQLNFAKHLMKTLLRIK